MKDESKNNTEIVLNQNDNSDIAGYSSNNIISLFAEYNKLNNIDDVSILFTQHINSVCTIVESDILVIDMNKAGYDLSVLKNTEVSDLRQRIDYLIEEGIVDWAISGAEPQLIMDLQSQLKGSILNILLIPLNIDNQSIGIYIAFTEKTKETFDNSTIQFIKILSNFAANRIQIITNEKQTKLLEQKYLELNDRFINTLPLTSFGEISLTVLKEVTLPLQIIESNLNLIESGVGNLNRRLEIIKQQIKSINEIVSLLDDISADARNSEPEIINVSEMILETINIISTQIKSKGISIEVSFDNNQLLTKGIKTQLEFVLIQLINFLSLNPNESDKIYINITPSNNRTILISVRDEAKGFDHDTFESLLEMIKSNNSLLDIYQNFQSLKNILKINKSRIECISKPNDGTIFRIYLTNFDINKQDII
jgi:hypothetical protein